MEYLKENEAIAWGELSKLGVDGWEVVGVFSTKNFEGYRENFFLFKREIEEGENGWKLKTSSGDFSTFW